MHPARIRRSLQQAQQMVCAIANRAIRQVRWQTDATEFATVNAKQKWGKLADAGKPITRSRPVKYGTQASASCVCERT